MLTNIHRVPILFYFFGFSHPVPSYFSFHTHMSLSLCQDDMPHCHNFLYQQIPPTQFSFVEKRKKKKEKGPK